MDRRFDPRSIVTPYAFAVHPDLLGMPLATPWQRLGAILVDLLIIGLISQVGVAPLAVASSILLLWLAFRKPGRDVLGRVFGFAVGCLGLLILTVTVVVILLIRYGDQIREVAQDVVAEIPAEAGGPAEPNEESQSDQGQMSLSDLFQGYRGITALRSATTPDEAQALLNDLARNASDAGLSPRQILEILETSVPEEAPWAGEAKVMASEAVARLPTGQGERGALTADEESTENEPSLSLSPPIADSIARLNREIELAQQEEASLRNTLEKTEQALEAEQHRSVLDWLLGFIDDLGIGFGWAALYLTVSHAAWKGRSFGKKLFRTRVVMIDQRPLNWWLSFERAGGYAAGFATGLLGFAQVFWDPNRQAIHDKVAETIVIQEGRDPVPGPWVEEGNALWARGRSPPQETPRG
jgi:uncharacterized RDD family membrane protein YckC